MAWKGKHSRDLRLWAMNLSRRFNEEAQRHGAAAPQTNYLSRRGGGREKGRLEGGRAKEIKEHKD
jgi:hypothetical protein